MLIATPVHFREIERGSGVRATVTRLANPASQPFEAAIARVRAPYWLDLGLARDGRFVPLAAGTPLALGPGAEAELSLRLDTNHPEFPTARTAEDVAIELAAGEPVILRVFLDAVVSARAPYDGVLAIDFGTASTCYAVQDDESFGAPRVSAEIPSAIFFHDVADPENPRVSIGADAEHEIAARTHLASSYHTTLKRMLGGPPVRVIDPRGATAWYTPERIAGFFLREVLARARARDTGAPVARVVATWPPSFDERTIAALRASFEHALAARVAPRADEDASAVGLRLDEVSAAAFDHVLTRLYRPFRELKLERRAIRVLAIDVGGGTSDAVALDVELERRPRDATRIAVRLLGATGERRFGGEDVTTALTGLLQKKLALAILGARSPATAPEGAEARSPLAEVLRALAARSQDDDEDELDRKPGETTSRKRRRSPLAATVAELAARESGGTARGGPAVPGLERFACPDPEGQKRALERIAADRDAIARACVEGKTLATVLGPSRAADAEALEDALDLLVPVRPGRRGEPADPAREVVANALALELRQEAERLKRRLCDQPGEALAPAGELARLARWADVDPGLFHGAVRVTLEELEALVVPRIEAFVARARGLLERLDDAPPPTAVATVASGVEVQVDADALRKRPRADALGASESAARPHVLLCGNGSRFPAVRRAVREILAVGPEELSWTPERAKPMVAQGAAAEEALRRHFGGEFVEVELDGFAERLPYSVGLYHPDLEDSPAFPGGFHELFRRGARPGEAREVGAENPLVHPALERLKLYADDRDGARPRLVGKVDLGSEPLARIEPEPSELGGLRLRFELGANREIRVTDLARGTVHRVEPASEKTPAL